MGTRGNSPRSGEECLVSARIVDVYLMFWFVALGCVDRHVEQLSLSICRSCSSVGRNMFLSELSYSAMIPSDSRTDP